MPLFRRLHPENNGWNLSLVNVAVTGMEERQELGSNISAMFKKQEEIKKEWDTNVLPFVHDQHEAEATAQAHDFGDQPETALIADEVMSISDECDNDWQADESDEEGGDDPRDGYTCASCDVKMPLFARPAHERFHEDRR